MKKTKTYCDRCKIEIVEPIYRNRDEALRNGMYTNSGETGIAIVVETHDDTALVLAIASDPIDWMDVCRSCFDELRKGLKDLWERPTTEVKS